MPDPSNPAWPHEASDRVHALLGEVAGKELQCQRMRELLYRSTRQLSAWHEWYGRHQCAHIPPAGDVALQEEIAEVLRG